MLMIEIHQGKEIIRLLNELAQIVLTRAPITKETEKSMLDKIDAVKKILETAELKEE